ncbi:hypothetical protein B7494_g3161 [Chlorociboria aeruginascens]|nr:hypothetical protein B7494_g3161 [Chlorociboria aeruginascens]
MADESPIGSPLSDLSSEAFDGEEERIATEAHMPPAKRQKLGDSSLRTTPIPEMEDDIVSSDTSGEVPFSPSHPEEEETHGQVTICGWLGCGVGDLGNMDRLVEHIHNEHIETRQKKYTCEWSDCPRRSMAHASGYALKAHMRSHTREKPFYCALPECDRAFTRSDALAKHMRTVHETEALRPSDPIPKSMQPLNKSSRLKLILKAPQAHTEDQTPGLSTNGATNGIETPAFTSSYSAELGFTADEEARGPEELWKLLRRQVHWAEEEGELLKRQCEIMEEIRRKEWFEKEILLDQVIKNEIDWHERRRKVLEGDAQVPTAETIRAAAAAAMSPTQMPLVEDQREAAAVLASLHQA